MRSRGIALLGATGSIGSSTLRVVDGLRDRYHVVAVSANRNLEGLVEIARRVRPAVAVLADGDRPAEPEAIEGVAWRHGAEALIEAATHPDVDIVVNGLVGAAGLEPTLAALRAGKRVALANKESLVCGGPLVRAAAREGGGEIIPVDSEHSAIFQCMQGAGDRDQVRGIVLTASGGPFRDWEAGRLASVTPRDALRHPTWRMGAKISIDSATLANKALEVIEAHVLFDLPYDAIRAVVHPQSIVHSMVEFVDGSVLAQMGVPSMELPILYALTFPDRVAYECDRFDPVEAGSLTFEPVRAESFPTFRLGVEAGRAGGTFPAVFNAANEVVVAAFLDGRCDFPAIPGSIDSVLERWKGGPIESLEDVRAADRWAREETRAIIQEFAPC